MASPPIRRKRTKSFIVAEVARAIWATIEAQIEFPTLRPKANDAPQEPSTEEPQIEGLLYEKWVIKEGSTITTERIRKLEGSMQETGGKEVAHTG